jgi:hypothetical protein
MIYMLSPRAEQLKIISPCSNLRTDPKRLRSSRSSGVRRGCGPGTRLASSPISSSYRNRIPEQDESTDGSLAALPFPLTHPWREREVSEGG